MGKSYAKWQKSYITNVFDYSDKTVISYINKALSNVQLLNFKSKYLPNSLFRFYSLTANNVMDIKNRKLWLSDPRFFNDPYDCNIGYNSVEFKKNNC
ncbi:MAG: hypothetical protein ACOWWH_01035 [Eubacteriaceae bacterium]